MAIVSRSSLGGDTSGIDFMVVDADPSGGGGIAANIGSLAMLNTNGNLYTKTGGADTNWTLNSTSGGTGSVVLLDTQTVSTATEMDFTTGIDSTYDHYIIDLQDIEVSTDDTLLQLRVSNNGGTSYLAGASDYRFTGQGSNDGGAAYTNASTGDTKIDICRDSATEKVGNAAGEGYSGQIHLWNPSGTTLNKRITIDNASWVSAGSRAHIYQLGGYVAANTSAVDAIRVLPDAGTIDGTGYLYGVATS